MPPVETLTQKVEVFGFQPGPGKMQDTLLVRLRVRVIMILKFQRVTFRWEGTMTGMTVERKTGDTEIECVKNEKQSSEIRTARVQPGSK